MAFTNPYVKTDWNSGDIITEARLDKIEDQLEGVTPICNTLKNFALPQETVTSTSGSGTSIIYQGTASQDYDIEDYFLFDEYLCRVIKSISANDTIKALYKDNSSQSGNHNALICPVSEIASFLNIQLSNQDNGNLIFQGKPVEYANLGTSTSTGMIPANSATSMVTDFIAVTPGEKIIGYQLKRSWFYGQDKQKLTGFNSFHFTTETAPAWASYGAFNFTDENSDIKYWIVPPDAAYVRCTVSLTDRATAFMYHFSFIEKYILDYIVNGEKQVATHLGQKSTSREGWEKNTVNPTSGLAENNSYAIRTKWSSIIPTAVIAPEGYKLEIFARKPVVPSGTWEYVGTVQPDNNDLAKKESFFTSGTISLLAIEQDWQVRFTLYNATDSTAISTTEGANVICYYPANSNESNNNLYVAIGSSTTEGTYSVVNNRTSVGITEYGFPYWIAKENNYALANIGHGGGGWLNHGNRDKNNVLSLIDNILKAQAFDDSATYSLGQCSIQDGDICRYTLSGTDRVWEPLSLGPIVNSTSEAFSNKNIITIGYGVNDFKAEWKNTDTESQQWYLGSINQRWRNPNDARTVTLGDSTYGYTSDLDSKLTVIGAMSIAIENLATRAPKAQIIVLLPGNFRKLGTVESATPSSDEIEIESVTSGGTTTYYAYAKEVNNYAYGTHNHENKTLADYRAAIQECAEYYGVRVVDMGMCAANRINMNQLLGDGIHPTLAYYEQIGHTLAPFIR